MGRDLPIHGQPFQYEYQPFAILYRLDSDQFCINTNGQSGQDIIEGFRDDIRQATICITGIRRGILRGDPFLYNCRMSMSRYPRIGNSHNEHEADI